MHQLIPLQPPVTILQHLPNPDPPHSLLTHLAAGFPGGELLAEPPRPSLALHSPPLLLHTAHPTAQSSLRYPLPRCQEQLADEASIFPAEHVRAHKSPAGTLQSWIPNELLSISTKAGITRTRVNFSKAIPYASHFLSSVSMRVISFSTFHHPLFPSGFVVFLVFFFFSSFFSFFFFFQFK